MIEEYQNIILSLSEEKYRLFQMRICPGINNIVGVPIPVLRKIAKDFPIEEFSNYIKKKEIYYEEAMLKALLFQNKSLSLKTILSNLEIFVPKIDNWAVCDIICGGLKISDSTKDQWLKFLEKYLFSKKEFELRFVIVMLFYFIEERYLNTIFDILNKIESTDYYVMMAKAWLLSMCYVKYKEQTLSYIENISDKVLYNKTLSKIIESRQISKEEKDLIRRKKRK